MITRINVIDPDIGRRARVSRELSALGLHVEIYEHVTEFASSGAPSGLVFIAHEPSGDLATSIGQVREAMQEALPVVGYAEEPTAESVVQGMRAGALDYLEWPFESRLLAQTLKRISNGGDPSLRQHLIRTRARAKVQELSRRQSDVLVHLVRGHSNKEIACVLGISPRTVEIHRANMVSRLGAQSSPEAVRIGIHAGLDDETEVLELLAPAWRSSRGFQPKSSSFRAMRHAEVLA